MFKPNDVKELSCSHVFNSFINAFFVVFGWKMTGIVRHDEICANGRVKGNHCDRVKGDQGDHTIRMRSWEDIEGVFPKDWK